MTLKFARLNLLLLLAACNGGGKTDPDEPAPPLLIPQPVSVEQGEGHYTLDSGAQIAPGPGAERVAEQLAQMLRPATGLPLEIDEGGVGISLSLDSAAGIPAEGYTLEVDEDEGVTIVASDEAGLYYGAQTLRQLLSPLVYAASSADSDEWAAPEVYIEDAPRFPYRGFMLDVARHFFTIEEVERQIDLLAMHKMNRLHLHLTDDQGWRIEIQSWPDLAEIGGSTEVGGGEGGWYTQAELADLIAYAAERHVTIIPEIDLPGHANAALASYGELNEDGVPAELYTGEPVISNGLWLDGEATYEFAADVWTEVAALTPSEVVHIGGDEAIDIEDDDYAAFIAWLQGFLADQGKIMIGWDEIGPVPLDTPFYAQHWIKESRAIEAALQGGQVISSPAEHAYLDMAHDRSADYGQIWAGYVNIEAAYDWDPVPPRLDEEDIHGVEGALWTEFIDTEEKVDFMAWPRLAAHAEAGWTPQDLREWEDFRDRLAWHGQRLEAAGVGFYRSDEIDWDAL